jgi:glycosyltransferase involved in cell wall biosynthesis
MLAPEFIPIQGGVGTYIVELIRNMPQDVKIYVLTPKRVEANDLSKNITDGSFLDRVNVDYVGTAKDNFFYNFEFQINCFRAVTKMIKKYHIDIVHSQSALPDLYLSPKSIKIPIVTTIHTTIRDEINSTKYSGTNFSDFTISEKTMVLLNPILKTLEKSYYNGHRNYITVSNWMKSRVIKDFKKIQSNKIQVIYNGVNTTQFNSVNKKFLSTFFPQLSEINVPKVLFLSRWAERKGIRYFLEAIPQILKKTDIHFIFAGSNTNGTLKIPLENCSYLGYIPQEKLPCLYALCDIFVLPSLYENFPICLLEAMSSELAVISTNVGGIPELITNGENGVLIEPKNAKEIANSVIHLAENKNFRKELGEKARITIEKQFTWDRIAVKTREYYEKILEEKKKL